MENLGEVVDLGVQQIKNDIVCLANTFLLEYTHTEEHKLGLFLGTDVRLEIEVNTSIYTNLVGVNYIIITMTERNLAKYVSELQLFTSDTLRLLFDSIILYVDVSFTSRELSSIPYYISSNRENLKEVGLYTKFYGIQEDILDDVELHAMNGAILLLMNVEEFHVLKDKVTMASAMLSEITVDALMSFSNLKQVSFDVYRLAIDERLSCIHKTIKLYDMFSGIDLCFKLTFIYETVRDFEILIAALCLGTVVCYNGPNSDNLILESTDRPSYCKDKSKYTEGSNCKVGGILELALNFYTLEHKERYGTTEEKIVELVDYWKEAVKGGSSER